jgi:uncharacterized protein YjbI with pentapeptide repeats
MNNETLHMLKHNVKQFNEHYNDKEIDLSNADLSGNVIKEANLKKAKLQGANLSNTRFVKCDLSGAIISWAILNKTIFEDSTMEDAVIKSSTFNKVQFKSSIIRKSSMPESVFNECEIIQSTFSFSDLTHTTFNKGYFYKSEVQSCKMKGASITGIIINDTNFMDSDLAESIIHGKIIESSHFSGCILVKANFSETSFKGRLWSEPTFLAAKAKGANFKHCRMYGVDLSHADLENADFTDSSLNLVEISNGNLKNTNFSKCYITSLNVCKADLENTNFTDAIFVGFFQGNNAKFNNTIFTGAKGAFEKITLKNTIYEKTGLPIGVYNIPK